MERCGQAECANTAAPVAEVLSRTSEDYLNRDLSHTRK